MFAGGARPLEPYVDAITKWKCECLCCHRTIYPRLNQLFRAGPCAHCAGNAPVDSEVAAAEMRAAGFEPVEPYPGSSRPWTCICIGCGTACTPSLRGVRRGTRQCRGCAGNERLEHEVAASAMRAAGLEPLAPYPGAAKPWLCRCVACGGVDESIYSAVVRGLRGCRQCSRSLSVPGRSMGIYLASNRGLDALKVGIGIVRGDIFPRLRVHRQRGWVEEARWTGLREVRVASGVERLVLDHWRVVEGTGFVRPEDMPQGGWSETVRLSAVNVEDVVGMITVVIGEVAFASPDDSEGLAMDASVA